MILPSVARCIEESLKLASFAGLVKTSFKRIGELAIPSGKVAGGDPDFLKDLKPFDTPIRTGAAGVVLTLARYPDADERIAAARLELSPGQVARWMEVGTYGVDSGYGCFLDAGVAGKFNRQSVNTLSGHRSKLRRALERNYADTRSWGSIPIDPATGASLIAFSAGFGDGGYATYAGVDRNGKTLVLLTDFGLLLTADEIESLDEEL